MSAGRTEADRGSTVCRLHLARTESIVHRSKPILLSVERKVAGQLHHPRSNRRIWQRRTVPFLLGGKRIDQYPGHQDRLSLHRSGPEGPDESGLLRSEPHVVILEHKGLYWSKIKGTEEARTIEPDEQYIVPFGKARPCQRAEPGKILLAIITYGMASTGTKRLARVG